MSKSLFQIEQSMYNLLNYGVDDETGEIMETEEDFMALYDSIELDLHTKLDNTNCLGKVLDGEIDVIDKEIERLKKEKKRRENQKVWLSNRVDSFVRRQFTREDGTIDLEGLNKFKLDLPHSKISYRKSEVVNIIDESKIPSEYIKVKTETSPMKAEIKKALKDGKVIDGVDLVTNINMQIK